MSGSRGSPFDLQPRRETTHFSFNWVFPYAAAPVGRPLPMLRTFLELPEVGYRDLSLALDTGADINLIDGGWAQLVGFDPTRGAHRIEPVRGIGGSLVAYVHTVAFENYLLPPRLYLARHR